MLPFIILLTGVMVALYGGFATPSETAGLGAVLALAADRGHLPAYGRRATSPPILTATLRESTMLMLIIGMSLLYSYVMSYLQISQGAAAIHRVAAPLALAAARGDPAGWSSCSGFFLPPVSIILMTAPIILPPLKAAGFDLVWFGVVMTIVMEMG